MKRFLNLEREVQEIKAKLMNLPARLAQNAVQSLGGCGKLNGTLARGGNQMASVWRPKSTGGLDADTGTDVKVIDIGMTPVTLPSSTVVVWINIMGFRVVIAYDCSAV